MKYTKIGTTVRGLVGTDWAVISAARSGTKHVWLFEGSDQPCPTMPLAFRTCRDIGQRLNKVTEPVIFNAVKDAVIRDANPAAWGVAMSLKELAAHPYQGKALTPAVLKSLKATYATKG